MVAVGSAFSGDSVLLTFCARRYGMSEPVRGNRNLTFASPFILGYARGDRLRGRAGDSSLRRSTWVCKNGWIDYRGIMFCGSLVRYFINYEKSRKG